MSEDQMGALAIASRLEVCIAQSGKANALTLEAYSAVKLLRHQDALIKELEGFRADAARYRALRNSDYQTHEDDICVSDSSSNTYFDSALDGAVDALIERHQCLHQIKKGEAA